jgi:hypothetical protein
MSEQSPDSERIYSADDTEKQSPTEPLQANFGVPVPPIPEPQKKKRFRLNRRTLMLSVMLLLVAGCAAAYLFLYTKDTEPTNESTKQQVVSIEGKDIQVIEDQPFADKFIPNYSDVRGYIEYGGEHWYATFSSIIITKDNAYRLYTAKQFKDISSFTGMVEFDGSVWVSGQGGAAKQVSDKEFKDYLNGESNVQLYVDPIDNSLYAATFNNLYVYDKLSDAFSEIDTRVEGHSMQLGFNKQYVIAADINRSGLTSPLRLYDKKSKSWSDTSSGMFGSSGISGIVRVEQKTLIYGRTNGYESCEQAGIIPSGDFYQVEEDGSLTQLPELVELFKNNEAYAGPYSATSLRGSRSCNADGTDEFAVDLAIEDDKIVAKKKAELGFYSGTSYYTYLDKVEQLQAEIGFGPKISLVQSRGEDVLSIWADVEGKSALYSTKNVVKSVQKVDENASEGARIVACGGDDFIINGTSRSLDYSGPYLLSISKVGTSENEVVYETTNEPQYEGVSAELDLAHAGAICVDNKIILLGSTRIGIFDPTSKKLNLQPHGYNASVDSAVVAHDGASFIFIDYVNKKLVRVGADVSKLTAVPVAEAAIMDGEDGYSTHLYLADDELAVFSTRGNKQSTRIVTVSAKDGSVIEKTDVERVVVDGAQYDATRFVLQYDNGETKLVDNKTLKGTTISKETSISSGDQAWFALVKDPNSEFIVADGYVWFSAANWGVVGYKAE